MESGNLSGSCGLDRATFLRRGAFIVGLVLGGRAAPALAAAASRVAFADWMLRFFPQLLSAARPGATETWWEPRFVNDARRHEADADVYVGLTPFDDMTRLVDKHVLAPWQVMPGSVRNDMPDVVVKEGTIDGQLYNWPLLLDVTVLGWNAELVARAGLDPARPPQTWDELIAAARRVVRSGAAPYGCTFDPRPWRSLVPVTYSFDANVYDEHGLFDYRSDATRAALEVLRQLSELANPDIFTGPATQGSTAHDPTSPDEAVFRSGLAAYYVKYQNAPVRMAASWRDPGQLVLARLPRPPGGAGKTVFWTTGIGLLRYGRNAAAAARYARAISYGEAIWRASLATGRESVGELPVFEKLWHDWQEQPPPWLGWAEAVWAQLEHGHAEPIPPSRLGAQQFGKAQQHALNAYLDGSRLSAKKALKLAAASVHGTAG
jgi:multiple sugar transport system substrate-binding protein